MTQQRLTEDQLYAVRLFRSIKAAMTAQRVGDTEMQEWMAGRAVRFAWLIAGRSK